MSKKLLSVLVVLALALSMIPVVGLPATEANAASDVNKNLSFKADGKTAYCPHCKADVVWTDVHTTSEKRIGHQPDKGQLHYYLSKDLTAPKAQFLETSGSTKICFHLNGKNLSYGGRMYVATGTELAVMGNGNVTFRADVGMPSQDMAGIEITGKATIYGGTWKLADGLSDGTEKAGNYDAAAPVGTRGVYVGWAADDKPNPTLVATGDAKLDFLVLADKNVGRVTIDENANLKALYMGAASQLTVAGTWTGKATVIKSPNNLANFKATGKYTGTLMLDTDGVGILSTRGYYISENGTSIIKVLACIGDKWYASLGKAVEAYTAQDFADGKVITVHCDASKATTVAGQSYYIDLNGFQGSLDTTTTDDTYDRVPIMIDGAGTVYLLDSANDTYDASKCGKAALVDGCTATIKEETTVGGKQYFTLQDTEAKAYRAHRLTLEVTDAVLRTSENGMFFKAEIKADKVLGALIKACGVVVSNANEPTAVVENDNAFTKLDFTPNSKGIMYTNSALVKNIFKDAADATNKTRGETKIYAKAYITLQKGDQPVDLFSEGVSSSAADILKAIDTKWSSYNAKAQANAKSFFAQWKGKGASGNRIEDLGLTNIK